jgi:cell division transport system permease protein
MSSSPAKRGGAPRFSLSAWLLRHVQVFFYTLGQLYRTPLSSMLTILVIGIALALPAGLKVMVDNTRGLSGSFEGAARISVFMQQDITAKQRDAVADLLGRRDDVESVTVIPAEQALEEFRELSGFGSAIDALEENPLPAVLVIHPAKAAQAEADLSRLVTALDEMPETDIVQLDAQWLKRLNAILEIINRGILVIAAMFGLAVVVTVGNTIRLEIQNRRDEIIITKLIGATNAFIRRPFLYTGFWVGFGGGLMAWILVLVALLMMESPVSRLAGLYGSGFQLSGLGMVGGISVLAIGAALGWLGSAVAVGRHLGAIEPK